MEGGSLKQTLEEHFIQQNVTRVYTLWAIC